MAKNITIKMDVRSAAAVRQILFEHQKSYTYDVDTIPPRITDIRNVITDIDKKIEEQVKE
jgi:hypothetical protein